MKTNSNRRNAAVKSNSKKYMPYYFDPIRKKKVHITPEEKVRQEVIAYLLQSLHIPENMIQVERRLSAYGNNSTLRADIVIEAVNNDNKSCPLAVVECKAPNIMIDNRAINQALRYADIIGAEYVLVTNGNNSVAMKYDKKSGSCLSLNSLPDYNHMRAEIEPGKTSYARVDFRKIGKHTKEGFPTKKGKAIPVPIGTSTPAETAAPAWNLYECLIDDKYSLPVGNYGQFRVIEDSGVTSRTYGDDIHGKFAGRYRTLLVEYFGKTHTVAIGMPVCTSSDSQRKSKTHICVAIGKNASHHTLELALDDDMTIKDKVCELNDSGYFSYDCADAGKISELKGFARALAPEIICDNGFCLGTLTNDRHWQMNDEEIQNVIGRLISYSFVSYEYCAYLRRNRAS